MISVAIAMGVSKTWLASVLLRDKSLQLNGYHMVSPMVGIVTIANCDVGKLTGII